jgi:hypothetical protein
LIRGGGIAEAVNQSREIGLGRDPAVRIAPQRLIRGGGIAEAVTQSREIGLGRDPWRWSTL